MLGSYVLVQRELKNSSVLVRVQKGEINHFENGSAAFEKKNTRKTSAEQQRIEQLEAKLRSKNNVLSELMEEHVKSNKDLANLCPRPGCPMIFAMP